MAPVRLVEPHAVPLHRLSPQQLRQRHVEPFGRQLPIVAEHNKFLGKTEDVAILSEQAPIEPRNFAVVAKRVVVAILRAPNLVAHQQHWCPRRKERYGEKILDLTSPEALGFWITYQSLAATVPAEVVIHAVAVILTVGFVVLTIERHQ